MGRFLKFPWCPSLTILSVSIPYKRNTHLGLERLLGLVELDELGVLLAHQRLEVGGVARGLVGALVGQLQLAGDVVVVGRHRLELVLQLGLDHRHAVVDVGDLGDARRQLLDLALHDGLVLGGRAKVELHRVQLLLDDLQLLDGDLVLLDGGLQLPVWR